MTAVIPDIRSLHERGFLRAIDVHVAEAVARLAGSADPLVLLGAAIASRAPASGHVCAELNDPGHIVRLDDDRPQAVEWPEVVAWQRALRASGLVADGNGPRLPLVLNGAKLYLDRYWQYQRTLVESLTARSAVTLEDVDPAIMQHELERFFPPAENGEGPDLQRHAAYVAAVRALSIITGGPGTGKTRTVLRVLALIAKAQLARGIAPRIVLAAPTGKAAARLADSVRTGLVTLDLEPAVAAAIPRTASTIHRLLGTDRRRPTQFRHGPDNLLPADIIVVDEVSMVDLALMAKLVSAVDPGARLILLGDPDQLSSVDAGAILADICGRPDICMSRTFAAQLADATDEKEPASSIDAGPAIRDCVVRLEHSYRFSSQSGIGALARAINAGDPDAALRLLRASESLELLELPFAARDCSTIREAVVAGYEVYLQETDPRRMLEALDEFRVLCAHRDGLFGVDVINESIQKWLEDAGYLTRSQPMWFHGLPILITANSYDTGLYNGDLGLVIEGEGGLAAWFPSDDDETGYRKLSRARLPAFEAAFAITIHKSQGSEFARVVTVLPNRPSPVVTRELLYTAVSRATKSVTIAGTVEVLRAGILERVQRASDLGSLLWGAEGLEPGTTVEATA